MPDEIHVCTLQQLADSFDVHPLKIRCLVFCGLMPGPVLVNVDGTDPQWSCEEIADWLAAGMPIVDPDRLLQQAGQLPFLTPDQLARLLGCNRSTIHRMERDGRLPRPVLRGHRLTRWAWSQIRDWIDAGCPAVDPAEESCPASNPECN